MSDPLADIVKMLVPRVPYTKIVHGSGSWRVERNEVGKLFYCMLLTGRTLLAIKGAQPISLAANDFVLMPAAPSFAMSSFDPPCPPPVQSTPVLGEDGIVRIGALDETANVQMLIGYCDLGSSDAQLLVSLLPELVVVRNANSLKMLSHLITDEARSERPGRDVVLEHLLQVMMIEALRSPAENAASPGLLKGLADRRLQPALLAIHAAPAQNWSVANMARIAGLSRSALFVRFSRHIGMSPMEYLQSWRIALAKELLRQGHKSIEQIATEIGYGSASAFSIAFSKQSGMPPGQFRASARAK